MMNIENNEQQDARNLTRRISKPRVQYSPILEINKKRLSTTKSTPLQDKQKLDLQRFNSSISSTTTLNDLSACSTSAYSTRENSYFDEGSFEGVDIMTQNELRAQLDQVDCRDFVLPAYDDLRSVILQDDAKREEEPQNIEHQNVNDNNTYFGDSNDIQEGTQKSGIST